MCPRDSFIPHRENGTRRYCFGCGALLCSRNLTESCYPCDPTWGTVADNGPGYLHPAHREELGDAMNRVLALA